MTCAGVRSSPIASQRENDGAAKRDRFAVLRDVLARHEMHQRDERP
jgi:hypothetical protein